MHSLRSPSSASRALLRAAVVAAVPLLSGCCGWWYYQCAPEQPAAITARQNVATFTGARDQAEGLLAASADVFDAATVASIAPRYAAAADAANGWIDYAENALASSGAYDLGESTRRLDVVVARVREFSDAVEAAAVPEHLRVQRRALPDEAIIDQLTGAPPIVQSAEYVADGVAQGANAIETAQRQVSALDPARKAIIARTIASARWRAPSQVLHR